MEMINDAERLQNIKVQVDELMEHMSEEQRFEFVQRWNNTPKSGSIAENLQKKLAMAEAIISSNELPVDVETNEFIPDIQSVEYQNVFSPTTRLRLGLGVGGLALAGGIVAGLVIKNIFSKQQK
jgi:hypothetical protein